MRRVHRQSDGYRNSEQDVGNTQSLTLTIQLWHLVSGTLLIFHLLTGHLLTDICWLDICWLGLDICWLRHLLILATPAICWLWKDVCWFRHLLIQTIADSVITHISVFTTAVYHFNAQRGKFVHLYKLRNLPTFSKKLPQKSRILSKLKGNFQKTQHSSKSTTLWLPEKSANDEPDINR